jgi:hypothetical protein
MEHFPFMLSLSKHSETFLAACYYTNLRFTAA